VAEAQLGHHDRRAALKPGRHGLVQNTESLFATAGGHEAAGG